MKFAVFLFPVYVVVELGVHVLHSDQRAWLVSCCVWGVETGLRKGMYSWLWLQQRSKNSCS